MNPRELQQKVKNDYDQLPYPGINNETSLTEGWSWVNTDWITSLLPFKSDNSLPFRRILIAGCGTGNEAFEMYNRFPDAEITAVDYSEPAIQIAREYQKKYPQYSGIQFELGDLTAGESNWAKTGYYDFISCHGVLSYIPDLQAVFDSFAKCLSPEGTLYLGVNGATHSGITIRNSFDYFGYTSNRFEDTLKNRQLIELFDRLRPTQEHMANHSAAYLNSDILTAFSQNLSLNEWIGYAGKSNLHFISSAGLIPNIAKTLSANIFPLLISKSRKEICEIIELNNTASFHRLIFSKRPPCSIPWDDFDTLLDCEFQTTRLYNLQNPASRIYGELILNCTICEGYDIHFRWPAENISIKLLDQKDTSIRIKDALENEIDSLKDDRTVLIHKLFMFYQLGMINIFPTTSQTDN